MDDNLFECVANFNTNNSLEYTLLIEVGANYYSYAIIDDSEKLKAIFYSNETIASSFDNDSLLKLTFKAVKVSLFTQNFSFIPTKFYNQNQQLNYNPFFNNHPIAAIHSHTVLNQQITAVNTFNEKLINLLKENFPLANIYPQYLPFIESTFKQYKAILGTQVFLNVQINNIELLILQDGNLNFYNVFECFNNDEVLYYTLLACKKNQIKPPQVTLRVCGNLTQDMALYQQLSAVFTDIRLTKTNAIYVNTAEFTTIEPNKFFSLLSLIICA